MGLSITNWNIEENRDWYVRLFVSGGLIVVGLYEAQALAVAGDPAAAYAVSSAGVSPGSDVPVVLTPVGVHELNFFQEELEWHLSVSGAAIDPATVVKVAQFTDLPEIRDSIFVNEDLVQIRARAEIDNHTHARLPRDIAVETHYPSLRCGQIVEFTSIRRGKTQKSQLVARTISFEQTSDGEVYLGESLTLMNHLALRRG
jgi:hypothetical protein